MISVEVMMTNTLSISVNPGRNLSETTYREIDLGRTDLCKRSSGKFKFIKLFLYPYNIIGKLCV